MYIYIYMFDDRCWLDDGSRSMGDCRSNPMNYCRATLR